MRWSEVRAFAAAFGGLIGVALLLGVGLAVLLLVERLFFRDEGERRDGPGSRRS